MPQAEAANGEKLNVEVKGIAPLNLQIFEFTHLLIIVRPASKKGFQGFKARLFSNYSSS